MVAPARKTFSRRRGPLDQVSAAMAFSQPGSDPRTWVSYATVSAPAEDSVLFDPELGPLITVDLQPSKVRVRCRVASQCAGNGEGEYNPFVTGDEVIVLIPEGNERAGCVIIGRLNNGIDKFPAESVAGQDPTANAFAFRRQRTPFIHETSSSYMVRSALSGAFFGFDLQGQLTIRDGTGSALQMGADAIGFQSEGDPPKYVLQIDKTGGRFTLQVDDAVMTLSSSSADPQVSAINTPGTLELSTNANPAAEHVLTTEAFVHLFVLLLTAAGTAATPPFTFIPAPPVPASPLYAALATAISGAAVIPQNPALGAALFAAFSALTQKPPGAPGLGQAFPQLGSLGTMTG